METPRLDPWYLSDEFTAAFGAAFSDTARTEDLVVRQPGNGPCEGILTGQPFHTGRLRHVLPAEFLRSLRAELSGLAWRERHNDLYWFHQTDDLALNGLQHVKALRQYLAGDEFVGFMEKLTGVQLSRGYLDMAAQRYKKGNHLLCHDDDVHRGELTRRIAYIIYLVDDAWGAQDGGALGLFDTDAAGLPRNVVARLVPEFNSMGFFLTGLASYHTVEEVTVPDDARERWSVTGWFYGPVSRDTAAHAQNSSAPLPPATLPPMRSLEQSASADTAAAAARWINADYLQPATQTRVQDAFLAQSSVELRGFLLPSAFAAVRAELDTQFWASAKEVGPAHLRRYLEADAAQAPSAVADLLAFLRSEEFAQLLTRLTSLDLVGASQQLRRFARGHYTLMHDEAIEPPGLDATLALLPLGESAWDDACGGAMHYVADKDELLRVAPEPNSLSLVLRDEGTMRFVKYLSHTAPPSGREEIAMVFAEADEASEEDEAGEADDADEADEADEA